MRSRRRELLEPGLEAVGRRGQGRLSRHHAEQRREGEIATRDFGQALGPVLRVGATHEREIRHGDVDFLGSARDHIEPHIGALLGASHRRSRQAHHDGQEGPETCQRGQ